MRPRCSCRLGVVHGRPARPLRRVAALALVVTAISAGPTNAAAQAAAADSAKRLDSLAAEAKGVSTPEAQRRALKLYTQAAELYRRAGDRRMQGVTLRQVGNVYFDGLHHRDSALVFWRQALQVAREAGNLTDEFNAAFNIRLVQSSNFTSSDSREFWQQAVLTARRAGDRVAEGRALLKLSDVYFSGEHQSFDSMLTYAKQAAQIAREVGARWDEGRAYAFGAVGHAYMRIGQLDSAEAYFREDARIARAAGDRSEEAAALGDLGGAYMTGGRYDSALVYFRQAVDRFRAAGNRWGEGNWLGNIGSVFVELGRFDSALVYHRRALQIAREVSDGKSDGGQLSNIANTLLRAGRADSAAVYAREAARIAHESGDRMRESWALATLGEAERALGRPDSALASLRPALALQREIGIVDVAYTLDDIGGVHRDAGRLDSALANYRDGLKLAREADLRTAESALLTDLGDLYYKWERRPDLEKAVAYYDSAAAVRAAVASHAGSDPSRVSFAELGATLYEHWALAWLARAAETGEQQSALAALTAAERGRAQALLELLRRTQDTSIATSALTATLDSSAGADLVAEGRALTEPMRRSGAAALSYFATEDTLLSWLVLPSGEVVTTRTPIKRDSLAALVSAVRTSLGAGEGRARATANLERSTVRARRSPKSARAAVARLTALVLPEGLLRQLPDTGELVIVPQGALALVPFAALSPGARCPRALGLRYAIRYAPSLVALRAVEAGPLLATRGVGGRALVVGNPAMPRVAGASGERRTLAPLPGAEREGRWVAAKLGTEPLIGWVATERFVRKRLSTAPLVHLATHGFAYSADADVLKSFVALAPDKTDDGLFTVGEVIDEVPGLSADLVVLSACQTGLGNLKQAEGTVGLQRAFLAKGARSVLVSLWSVSDEATELLMRRFYAHWLDDTDEPSKAEALRRAQTDVRNTRGFEHPRYWAPFQLVGAR